MSASPAAVAHQEQLARLTAAVARAVRAEWKRVDPQDVRGSWQARLDRVVALITAGQIDAARRTEPWLSDLLADIAPEGEVVPEALAGVAADGRPLPTLLMYPVWAALKAIARGANLARAMATGQAFLDLLTRTVITDTARSADLTGMIARSAVTSYIRVVSLPACARCLILAGREYSLSTGFQRHPRCDCTMEPITLAHEPTPVSPEKLYEQMTEAQRRKAFGADGVRAIGDGADMSSVVNARRGMKTATAYGRRLEATTEGITRRGIAGRRLGSFAKGSGSRLSASTVPRMMPAEIYRQSESREQAIRLLRLHGYIH